MVMAILVFRTLFAGGILTNTNQSVSFLRNPARDAAIGLDGVYSNPAGVAFLNDGFHLGFNWQYAHQTRTIRSTSPLYTIGYKNNGLDTKTFEGVANAPFIPSLQAAYNKNNWSFQLNLSVPGGGGQCEFSHGLGSFETVVGAIANRLMFVSNSLNSQISSLGVSVPAVTGYDVDGYMCGKQYYFGIQLGTAYKFNEHLSVYGGLRLLYGSASYEARLNNIRVMNGNSGLTLPEYFEGVIKGVSAAKSVLAGLNTQVQDGITQYVNGYMAAGMTREQAMQTPEVQALTQRGQQLQAAGQRLQGVSDEVTANAETLAPYSNGVNLKSDQTGLGIAPIIGIDYKVGNFNLAAKYEFRTRMRMKNNSSLKEATVIAATNKFVDGTEVPEDAPAQLAIGAQWSVTPDVRLNLGYHHFYDTDAHWYEHSEKLLDGGTNEYLAGAEWDITKKLQVSGGAQITRYQLTDDYMNDMSFVVNSWTFGVGLGYQVSDKVKLSAAYFQTNYSDYDKTTPERTMAGLGLTMPEQKETFTRTNRVLGVGVEVNF